MRMVPLIKVAPVVNSRVNTFEGTRPYLATGGLNVDVIEVTKLVTYKNRPSRADLTIQENDVICARMKETCKVLKIDPENKHHLVSTGFSVHRSLPDRIDSNYLAIYMKTKEFQRQKDKYCTGATQKAITNDGIKKLKIPIPFHDDPAKSLNEQKRIASILGKADVIRKKRLQAIKELNNLIHAAFTECFCKSMNDNSCHEDLVHLADIVSGVTKGRKFNGKSTVMLPYIRVANVQAGYLDLSEIKDIEALPEDLGKYRLEYGDILLTEGGDYDKLGRGTMWEGQIENCIHQNHVFRVRVNKELVLSEYFDIFLQTQFAKAYFLRCAKKTSNLASINMTQLRKLPVPVPEMSLQSRFADLYHKHNDMARLFEMNLDEAKKFFNSLVQRAFKGEL